MNAPNEIVDPAGSAPVGEPYADVLESHLSAVVLLGGLAFKTKKPLRLPFIDLSTAALRREVCRAELELNRRITPDVYLGVAELTAPELPAVSGEPVLVMRRLPRARRLSALLGGPEDLRSVVADVARQVARLHAAEPAVADLDLAASTERLWAAGCEQLTRFRGVVLPAAELAELTWHWMEYLAGRRGLLQDRERRGLVRDGHGDLLADDVFCLPDGPRILDCLEFDRALRVNDVLADVAFLAMDLELRGAGPLADLLVQRYREHSGEQHPRSLEHHYVAYRAFVRAKVECLRSEQGDPDAAGRARALLDLAVRRLRSGRVHLVLVGGLPGAGKSTFAAAVAGERTDSGVTDDGREWALLSSDVVRRDLTGGGASAGPAAFGEGAYDAAHTDATYAELLRRAGVALASGVNVVLDASWTDPRQRAAAARLAAERVVPLTEVRCTAPLDVCAARLGSRIDAHASDAEPQVLAAMAARCAPWPTATDVDTTQPPERALARVRALLAAAPAPCG